MVLAALRKTHPRTNNLEKIINLDEKYKWFHEGYKQSEYSVILKCFFNLLHVKRHKKYIKIIFFVFFRIILGLVLLRDFRKQYFDYLSILVIQNWTTPNTSALCKTILYWFWISPKMCFIFTKNKNDCQFFSTECNAWNFPIQKNTQNNAFSWK